MFAEINPASQKFILIFFRVAAILWLVPIFSTRSIGGYYKAAFSLVMAFLLFESVQIIEPLEGNAYGLLLLVVREVSIGLAISFLVRILFMIVTAAGEIISFQSAFSFAQFMDPFTNTQVSPLVEVKNLLAMLIFFAMDIHHSLIKGLAVSFAEVPIGTATLKASLFQHMIGMTAKLFSLGLKIGSPIIVTLFLVELVLGLLSRMIPQINIFIEGVPLKILVTIIVFSFSLSIIAPAIAALFRDVDTEMLKVLRLMV